MCAEEQEWLQKLEREALPAAAAIASAAHQRSCLLVKPAIERGTAQPLGLPPVALLATTVLLSEIGKCFS